LNRKGSGPPKRISQCLWDEKYIRNQEMNWNHPTAAELLDHAWTRLPIAAILAAWDFQAAEQPEVVSVFEYRTSSSHKVSHMCLSSCHFVAWLSSDLMAWHKCILQIDVHSMNSFALTHIHQGQPLFIQSGTFNIFYRHGRYRAEVCDQIFPYEEIRA
jgi:hypothetical protein